jgi:hypothetical protein
MTEIDCGRNHCCPDPVAMESRCSCPSRCPEDARGQGKPAAPCAHLFTPESNKTADSGTWLYRLTRLAELVVCNCDILSFPPHASALAQLTVRHTLYRVFVPGVFDRLDHDGMLYQSTTIISLLPGVMMYRSRVIERLNAASHA